MKKPFVRLEQTFSLEREQNSSDKQFYSTQQRRTGCLSGRALDYCCWIRTNRGSVKDTLRIEVLRDLNGKMLNKREAEAAISTTASKQE